MKKHIIISTIIFTAFHSIHVNASEQESKAYQEKLEACRKYAVTNTQKVASLECQRLLGKERSIQAVRNHQQVKIGPTKNPQHMTPEDFKK
ncbi:MAG: hypothetical protein J0H12_05270 [Candidatus Paracaedimonas acanthamoebae]|uniref:Uncharacterized protein n=1 Tax=Candidatus Paracaedimonas acanthamoebae TaxID=244581 RepID=A0A8J7Q1B4_9PROT|nr:hypothetical protein [Candidatus Paracaedimonas acanthamoebae]